MPNDQANELPMSTHQIQSRIQILRSQKVIFDRDLAEMYGVTTKALNQAVKRNLRRFPSDFMFQLSDEEMKNWKSQFVTSNSGIKMGLRKRPHAFTEQGVAMLSSVLSSERAIQANIHIMRTFVRVREIAGQHRDLWIKIDQLEKKYDSQFQVVFKAIKLLIDKNTGESDRRF